MMALLLLFVRTVSNNTKRVYYIKQEYYDLEFVKTFVFNLEKKPTKAGIKPLIHTCSQCKSATISATQLTPIFKILLSI